MLDIQGGVVFKRMFISPGVYENKSTLLKVLNDLEKDDPRPIRFDMNKFTRKSSVRLWLHCGLDWNGSDIAKCLGFDSKSKLSTDHHFLTMDSFIIYSMDSITSIYVYTDIIEDRQVGDFKVPLLRVIPIKTKFGEINSIHYDKPHFLRLSRENINNIEINIRDDTSEFVSFESGKVIVTLVFRRISTRFYQ